MEEDASGQTGAPRSASSEGRTTSLNHVFELLSDERRRFVLNCLEKYDNPMPLADVADELAVWEHETEIVDIAPEDVKNIYISLYHTHIPKLSEAGIVEYNQEQDSVTLVNLTEDVAAHLDAFEI